MGEMLATFTAGDASVADVLQRIVSACSYLIERVDAASITLMDAKGQPFTSVCSEQWIVDVDRLQYNTGEGPCLEVAATSAPAAGSADLADSTTWPTFGPAAAKAGVGALLAVGLSATPDPNDPGSPPGALNLYSRSAYAFDDQRKGQAVVLAAFAGAAVRAAQAREETKLLREALASRDVIGQAKGILMERHGISADQAFDVLRRSSNRLNVKLREVAAGVAANRYDKHQPVRKVAAQGPTHVPVS